MANITGRALSFRIRALSCSCSLLRQNSQNCTFLTSIARQACFPFRCTTPLTWCRQGQARCPCPIPWFKPAAHVRQDIRRAGQRTS